MENTSFYVTLPSNASMDIHPNNKQASFQVRLPRTMYLRHAYEVALVEIQYPVSWKTFIQEQSYAVMINNRKTGYFQQVFFPSIYYQNIRELVGVINQKLRDFFILKDREEHAMLLEDNLEQKIRVETSEDIFLLFSNECYDVLGLPHDRWVTNLDMATYNHGISNGFHSLYVYCNICEPQIVGDVYAPLLRSVAISGKRGDHIIKSYGEPHYITINSKQVETIEINIKDDTGYNVPFMSGKVICKLHFRQRSL